MTKEKKTQWEEADIETQRTQGMDEEEIQAKKAESRQIDQQLTSNKRQQERQVERLQDVCSSIDNIEQQMPDRVLLQPSASTPPSLGSNDDTTSSATALLRRIGSAQEQMRLATQQSQNRESSLQDFAHSHTEDMRHLSALREDSECADASSLGRTLDSLLWLNSLSQKEIEESERKQN